MGRNPEAARVSAGHGQGFAAVCSLHSVRVSSAGWVEVEEGQWCWEGKSGGAERCTSPSCPGEGVEGSLPST